MLVDAQARKSALKIENKIIKAPAGSGKTELLTKYYLKLLAVVEHPRQIAAMTFTNKASREMAERVIGSMRRVEEGFVPVNENEQENYNLAKAALDNSRARGWGVEQNVNMLQVSTIDSFCKKLLINNVGSDQEILATRNIANDPYRIYERAIRETMDLYTHEKYGPLIQKLCIHFNNKMNRVQQLLVEMLETRERWMPALFENKLATKEKLENERKEFVEMIFRNEMRSISYLESRLQEIVSQLSVSTPSLHEFMSSGFSESLFDNKDILTQLASIFATKVGKPKKRFTKNDGIPEDLSKSDKKNLVDEMTNLSIEVAESLSALKDMPSYLFKESEWLLLDTVFELMPVLLANLKLSFKVIGEVDFTEIAINAVNALNSYGDQVTDAAINKSQTIKHILVDEFQDSNDTQLVMLKLLIQSWAEGDGNSLFLVGDAMQSLYGFRGANVNVFMGAEEGVGHLPLKSYELKTNFRSTSGVVEWVNKVFSKAFPSHNDMLLGASKYTASAAVKVDQITDKSVEVHGFIDDIDSVEEARFIVNEIKSIQESEPHAKIAVLGRTRSALSPVIDELSSRGDVEAQAVDVNKIAKEPTCITAIALARVLIDDLDKLAWIELLNSGLLGLTHAEIEKVLLVESDPMLAVMSDDALENIQTENKDRYRYFIENMTHAFDCRHNRPLDQLLNGLWFKLHGLSLAKNKQDIENVNSVFAIFRGYDYTEINYPWFERQLDSLYSASESMVGGTIPNVELMTIHKSKGLEFDYIFVPGMHKKGSTSRSRLLSWSPISDPNGAYVMATSEAMGIQQQDVSYHKFLNKLKAQRELQELVRLVYVATTRAIKKAYLTGSFKSKEDGVNTPSTGTMLGVVFKGCSDEIVFKQGNIVDKQKMFTPLVSRINADLMAMLPERNTLAAYRGTKQVVGEQNVMSWHKPISKLEGVVIHQVIERINLDGIDKWDNQKVDEYSSVILASLKELSVERDHLLKSVNTVKAEIRSLLVCPVFRSIASAHKRDDVELRLSMMKNRKLVNLQLDKGFIEQNGSGQIIDWKSAALSTEHEINNFMNSQKIIYQEKLKAYGDAYKEVYGLQSVGTSLYFTKLNLMEECS